MWRSDHVLNGPVRATAADVEALNRVFSDAFTERYRRDGLSGVRVPYLNPAVWQFAIADAAEGAMLWRDSRGDVTAFNMVHRSGVEGWMGPLAVRTDRQGHGHGQRIVTAGVEWLSAQGVRTIGLETMPRTVDNIGFYSQLGFLPDHLTITLQRERLRHAGSAAEAGAALGPDQRAGVFADCLAVTERVAPGVDFSREIALTLELGLGDVSMLRSPGGALRGFALWHTAPLAQGRMRDELRVLKLVAADSPTAIELLGAVEREAATQGLSRVAVRCQTRHAELYAALIADGYRVQWTDLRMTLGGMHEGDRRGVMLSNWEI
jgi:GNAT superfamily N-acetyltransferase